MPRKKATPKGEVQRVPTTTPGYSAQCRYEHCRRYGPPHMLESHEAACQHRTKAQREAHPGDPWVPRPDLFTVGPTPAKESSVPSKETTDPDVLLPKPGRVRGVEGGARVSGVGPISELEERERKKGET